MSNRFFLSNQDIAIIKEVENDFSHFLDSNFNASSFLECKNNFISTLDIKSIKIFEMDTAFINTPPLFSIAIPTYNRSRTLKEAINSAIHQKTDEKYEILVVENTDHFDIKSSAQIMLEKNYKGKLTYYKNEKNLGMFGNWNRCLTLAKGRWVCILHSDDMISENYIEEMKKAILYSNEKQILIGCLEKNFGHNKIDSLFYDDIFNKKTMKNTIINFLFGNTKQFNYVNQQYILKFIPPSSVLHHREKCINIGGYNPDEYPIADNFFHTRAFNHGGICVYLKHLSKRRYESNESFNLKTQLAYCFIGTSFFLGNFPKQIAKYYAYKYLISRLNIIQNKGVKTYFLHFFSKYKTNKPFFFICVFKILFILRNSFRKNP